MSSLSSSKLGFLVNILNNLFHKRNLIILIGKNGITVCALKHGKLQNSLFVDLEDKSYMRKIGNFLKKYKKFYVVFLLDHKDCKLKHEMTPVLTSMLKPNQLDEFISNEYDPEDIVAYNVYDIDYQNGEVWNSCIASVPFNKHISKLLEYILNHSFKYSGMYFLSLEFETIINRILKKSDNTNYANHLQIFAVVTQSSGIRVVVKYKKDIMAEETIEYPAGKSDMYLLGTIEQAVSDKVLFYKEYIKKMGLETCVILLVEDVLVKKFSKLEFDNCTTVIVSRDEISNARKYREERFQDTVLMELFNNFNSCIAFNKPLGAITKMTFINRVFFKPVIFFLLLGLAALVSIKYQTILVKKEIRELNQKYYTLSEEYREVQKQHPDIENITTLVDLYNLQNLINKKMVSPTHLKTMLIKSYRKNVKITSLQWKVLNPTKIELSENQLRITMKIVYKGDANSMITGIKMLNEYVDDLRAIFPKHNFIYRRDAEEILQIANRITIPASVIIEGNTEQVKNAI
ncbi:MAG: hypothetical protein COA94_00390 [Rickettsiales bacterium]|nr:MAG: hypothetical protein COA94_00390 [Rickettsiales bacterium]